MLKFVDFSSAGSKKYWLLFSFLILVFLTGGSPRSDVQSLLILQPASVFVAVLSAVALRTNHITRQVWVVSISVALAAVTTLQLIPLPPQIWQALPGRGYLTQVDKLAGFSEVLRPFTLSPTNGWHVAASSLTALAILSLGTQLAKGELFRLLPLLLAIGLFSGAVGILQMLGNPEGPLYFYRLSNAGSAVGLFANRNHAATFLACLFPMLAVYSMEAQVTAEARRNRRWISMAAAMVLIPLILVIGSRTGLLVSTIGLAAAAAIYRRPFVENGRNKIGSRNLIKFRLLSIFALLTVGALTFFLSRAEAINRLFYDTAEASKRSEFWSASLDLFWLCFPWGCGSGSFVDTFKIVEPRHLFDATYLNHAHNDWLETALTFGILGVILQLAVLLYWLFGSVRILQHGENNSKSMIFGRMASAVMAILGMASLFDYPLRTPALQCVFIIAFLWFRQSQLDIASRRTPQTNSRL